VIARDIYLQTVPPALALYISSNFSGLQVKRASFDENNYKLFLSDNSVAVFSRYQGFQYRIKTDLTLSDLPTILQGYIPKNYPGKILKISLLDYGYSQQYELIMESGLKLIFDGATTPASQIYQYGFNPANLPDSAKTYLKKNYPQDVINNVVYNNQYNYIEYTAYLSSNARVSFDVSGNWIRTFYSKVNSSKMPQKILDSIAKRNPNPVYSEINYTIWPDASGSSGYTSYGTCEVFLANSKWFKVDWNTGEIVQFEYRNLTVEDLPAVVKAVLDKYYSKNVISEIVHSFDGERGEWYNIYFTDLTSVSIRPNGNLQK